MSEKARQFLIELSKDAVQMENFWKSPDAFLVSADLSAEEKDIFRSKDPERIQNLLGPIVHYQYNIELQCPHASKKPQEGGE